jgi:hypothetical protein
VHAKATEPEKEMENAVVIKDIQVKSVRHARKVSMKHSKTKASYFARSATSHAPTVVPDQELKIATNVETVGS